MPAMFIRHDRGDPEEQERKFNKSFAEKAGIPGRGEDWGVPLVVLHHLIGLNSAGRVGIDVFQDAEIMRELIFRQWDKIPPHLRPADSVAQPFSEADRERERQHYERDAVLLRVGKILPPLRATVSDAGGMRRPRF